MSSVSEGRSDQPVAESEWYMGTMGLGKVSSRRRASYLNVESVSDTSMKRKKKERKNGRGRWSSHRSLKWKTKVETTGSSWWAV